MLPSVDIALGFLFSFSVCMSLLRSAFKTSLFPALAFLVFWNQTYSLSRSEQYRYSLHSMLILSSFLPNVLASFSFFRSFYARGSLSSTLCKRLLNKYLSSLIYSLLILLTSHIQFKSEISLVVIQYLRFRDYKPPHGEGWGSREM